MPDILYIAITRPAMKMGVPVEGLTVNFVISYMAYLYIGHRGPFWALATLPVFPVVHFLMRLLVAWDHNVFRIVRLWLELGIPITTRTWGGKFLAAIPHHPPSSPRDIATSV